MMGINLKLLVQSAVGKYSKNMSEQLIIAGKSYHSRLLVGTGKYKDFAETRAAIDASGAQIVTVAIRRTNIGQTAGEAFIARIFAARRVYLFAQYCRLLFG